MSEAGQETRELVADFPSPTRDELAVRGELKAVAPHPSTEALMGRMAGNKGLSDDISPGYARRRFRGITPILASYPDVASVTDRRIAGPQGSIPIRIVRPVGDAVARPVMIWFPGGGYVLGDLDTGEPTARQFAMHTGAVVVVVDYRKAPEHRLDDAYDDALTVVRWVHSNAANLHIDPDRIIVGGDSAGGNIAAVVANELTRSTDPDPRIALQVLAYPAVSVEHDPSRAADDQSTLNNNALEWFEMHVAGSVDPRSTRYYPMATQDLAGLPQAIILTVGYDPLRDEAITYLDRLRDAGVRAEHLHYDDEVHGFLTMDLVLEQAGPAVARVADLICDMVEIPETKRPDPAGDPGLKGRLGRLYTRGTIMGREAVEHFAYRIMRTQRRAWRMVGLPVGRDIDRVSSQLLRLELQVRALRKALDEQNQNRTETDVDAD